jgi:hypothetical protein
MYTLDNGLINGIDYRNNKPILILEGNKTRVRLLGEPYPFIECDFTEWFDPNGDNFTDMAEFVHFWNQFFGDRSAYGIPGGWLACPVASDSVNLPNLAWIQNRGAAERALVAITEYGDLMNINLQPMETTFVRVTLVKVGTDVTDLYLVYFK